ncbi:MAG: O-antigen ligase family protein, partial [Puniceicoccales bacterium]
PHIITPIQNEPYAVKLSSQYEGRASGFFGAPASFAAMMLLIGFGALSAGFCKRFNTIIRVILIYFGLMMIGGILLSVSRGALILVVVGFLAIPVIVRAKWKTRLLFWALTIALLGAVGAMLMSFSDTFSGRVESAIEDRGEVTRPVMWTAAWEQFLDAPILGNGAGAYEYRFEEFRPEGFNRTPAHAHNDYLETLADQGIVGFALFWVPVAIILMMTAREWSRLPDRVKIDVLDERKRRPLRMPTQKMLLGSIGLAIFLFCAHLLLEFHLRVPGLLMFFFVLLACLAKVCNIRSIKIPRSIPTVLVLFVLGLAISIALPMWMTPRFIAHSYAQEGERALMKFTRNVDQYKQDQEFFDHMTSMLRQATERKPGNAVAWNNLSNAVAAQSLLSPAQSRVFGQEAEQYARRAIQLNPNSPQAWINLGNALKLQTRMIEAGKAYQKATEVGPNNAETWHFYAAYLDMLATTRGQALTAVDRALELDPGREDSQRLRKKILVP